MNQEQLDEVMGKLDDLACRFKDLPRTASMENALKKGITEVLNQYVPNLKDKIYVSVCKDEENPNTMKISVGIDCTLVRYLTDKDIC